MTKLALLSVSDKTGLVDFARGLAELGYGLVSTGGSAKALREAGLTVREVSELTGFPEMLDGRVKTLHPVVHGGLLARRELPEHQAALEKHRIAPIDVVAVNLYPFMATVARDDVTLEEAIENIDIGGPAMVRSSAKNYPHVSILVDPNDYAPTLDALRAGTHDLAARFQLARKAFAHTAAYDGAVSSWLGSRISSGEASTGFTDVFNFQGAKLQDLRYGENPHQAAAFYRDGFGFEGGIASARQLQGKELSYNNIADADSAWECVKALYASGRAACVIVKHANPCGAALGVDLEDAYRKAFACDPTSAFGGIIAFNREVDLKTAQAVSGQFVEVLIAPGYSSEALQFLAAKAAMRVLQGGLDKGTNCIDIKTVGGGFLVQSSDRDQITFADTKSVTTRSPNAQEKVDLMFAWTVAMFVKSNAIVYVKDQATVGIGAGQMSRLDSARIAAIKAEAAGLSLKGSVAASDAFFPFRDGLDVIAKAGATAVIQPGGSVRDGEVIAAANEQNIAMVTTGVRHFRH